MGGFPVFFPTQCCNLDAVGNELLRIGFHRSTLSAVDLVNEVAQWKRFERAVHWLIGMSEDVGVWTSHDGVYIVVVIVPTQVLLTDPTQAHPFISPTTVWSAFLLAPSQKVRVKVEKILWLEQ